jgi:PAS domain S-box-containing protein
VSEGRLWDLLMRQAGEAIVVTDLTHDRYVDASESFLELFALTRDQLVSFPATELLYMSPEEQREPLRAAVLGEEGSWHGTLTLSSLTGVSHVVDVSVTYDRQAALAIGLLRPIGERDEMARLWRTLMQKATDAVVVLDAKTDRYLWVSHSFEELTGFAAGELLGRTPVEVGIVEAAAYEQARQRRREQTALFADYVIGCRDGQRKVLSASFSVVDGMVVIVSRDVTADRQLEREKDDFISYASHELRTPIAQIVGSLQTIKHRPNLPAETRAQLEEVLEQSATRLHRLTEQLLDLDRVKTGAIEVVPERFELRDWLEELAGRAPGEARVDAPPELEVETDPRLLERVLMNLLTNAAKYGAPPISISGHRDGDVLSVAVADCGPGVAAEFRERMFDRFTRSERTAGDHQDGAGLGLAIAHTYANVLRGTLAHRDRHPVGTIFELRIPLRKPA